MVVMKQPLVHTMSNCGSQQLDSIGNIFHEEFCD